MDLPVTIISLAGSVALLLWGIRMVQTGVQRAFGAKLRVVLGAALRNRLTGFLAGIGVTAILQSSTATGLMVTGFVAGALVDLVPALGVMLGANVGTTLIVQVLSFNVSEIAPALVLVGFLLFQRATAAMRDVGRVLIGVGLVLLALHQFIDLLTPYENAPNLRLLLGAISTQPLVDILVACGIDLGRPFQRRRRAARDVFRGRRDGSTGCRLRSRARRQSRHGYQPGSRRRNGQRPRR